MKIHNVEIKQVSSYKYLGVVTDANLSLIPHIEYISNKIQQHIYLADLDLLELVARLSVFQIIILRVMLYWSAAWFSCLSVKLKIPLYNQFQICAKITGQPVAHLFHSSHKKSMLTVYLQTAFLLSPLMENTNFCPPTGDSESLHLIRLKHSFIHLLVLSC